jgi:hypothetical protein
MLLDRLPMPAEAELIREALAIPNARHLSEAHRERLIAAGTQARFKAEKLAKSDADDVNGKRCWMFALISGALWHDAALRQAKATGRPFAIALVKAGTPTEEAQQDTKPGVIYKNLAPCSRRNAPSSRAENLFRQPRHYRTPAKSYPGNAE